MQELYGFIATFLCALKVCKLNLIQLEWKNKHSTAQQSKVFAVPLKLHFGNKLVSNLPACTQEMHKNEFLLMEEEDGEEIKAFKQFTVKKRSFKNKDPHI